MRKMPDDGSKGSGQSKKLSVPGKESAGKKAVMQAVCSRVKRYGVASQFSMAVYTSAGVFADRRLSIKCLSWAALLASASI